jgi:hypothetical protein
MAVKANDRTKRERVIEILKRHDLDSSAVWDCHGTPVIFHWACERIAASMGIQFEPPVIIDQDTLNKTVTLLVSGKVGDCAEWSFGEVTKGNCQNAYPWAMAEKRAKDRVILKFAGLSGEVYSEEEADAFKSTPAASQKTPKADVSTDDRMDWDDLIEPPAGTVRKNAAQSREVYKLLAEQIDMIHAPEDGAEWAEANAGTIYSMSNEARHHLRERYNTQIDNIILERSAA